MKVVADSGPAPMIGGVDKPVSMGISDDPEDQLMILNVLSNTLYTDKVAAVLREYGCNAFDANVEAGRGHQPIEVRLPNKLDPTLAIRDFGFGMTEQQILQVFCRLGRSTKRNSNAFTGMLGIGSKAGFAYGDSFLVTSITDGVKAVYNCFRDRGAPCLSKMHEAPTDAPDGIEVKVPIRMGDFAEFVTKAERIFRYFAVRPIIQGAKIDWQERGVPEFLGTGWRYTGVGTSVALMGNVGYALTPAALPPNIEPRCRTLIELGVELDFEIGDLEIAANREGLQYKDHTIKSIVDRLKVAANEITKVFTDRIRKAPSLWEAHRMYGDNFEKMGQSQYGMRTLKEVVNQGITWKGIKIGTGRFELENKEKLPGVHVVEYSSPLQYRGKGSFIKQEEPAYTWASVKTVLVHNDLASQSNSPSRVKGFFETDTKGVERFITFTFVDDKIRAKYWKARGLEGAPTIDLSSVPPSVNIVGSRSSGPSVHRAKHSAKVFTLARTAPTDGWTRSKWWDNATVDLANDSGVYVKIDKFYGYVQHYQAGPPVVTDPPMLFTYVKELINAGLIKGPIYGFKPPMLGVTGVTGATGPTGANKLGKGWVSLEDHVKSEFDKWFINHKQEIADADAAQAHKEWFTPTAAKDMPSHTVMHKYLSAFTALLKSGKSVEGLVRVARKRSNILLPRDLPTRPSPTHDLSKLSNEAFNTYPLFAHINKYAGHTWHIDLLLKPAIQYVTLVNK